ncbi:MAG: non-homologous end-joining DNA ligase [Candidatus Eiseniibacteriota bacterium]
MKDPENKSGRRNWLLVRSREKVRDDESTRARAPARAPARTPVSKRTARTTRPVPRHLGTRLTHPDKVLYPGVGVTKRDLAAYYESMAERILPHVAGRPLMVVRCPEGEGGDCFYQKHATANLPPAIGSVRLKEESGKTAHYLSIADVEGLLALVQMDVLEIHVWGCRNDRIERPDRMVFDLDPGPGVTFERVAQSARVVRDRLEGLGLTSFLKTTGGRGLHVVVPLARTHSWDTIKSFSKAIAQSLAAGDPTTFTATLSKAKRRGAIFVDYLRNGRGATWVAPYSSRNRPGATVSTPIPWESLTARLQPERFTVVSLPRRVHRDELDPWRGMDRLRQSLSGQSLSGARSGRRSVS